jgi:hypothetical protein
MTDQQHPIASPPRLADEALAALGGRLDPSDFRIIDKHRHGAIHNALVRLKQLEACLD